VEGQRDNLQRRQDQKCPPHAVQGHMPPPYSTNTGSGGFSSYPVLCSAYMKPWVSCQGAARAFAVAARPKVSPARRCDHIRMSKATTSSDKQRQARQARLGQPKAKAKEEERTPENQRQITKHKRARNYCIINSKTQTVPPSSRTEVSQLHRVLAEVVTTCEGARDKGKEVRARLYRQWCPRASDRR
jgi:hypothetical protein